MSSDKATPNQVNELQQDVSGRPLTNDEQQLVAYLDGELDTDSVSSLESRLAVDETLRQQLHQLQQTWDMLDELPHTSPGPSFIKSTIEMVVTSADSRRPKWHRWPMSLIILAASFLLMSLIGFQIVRSIQNQPYQNFVMDLDFIENVDYYNEVEDIEFLEKLRDSALFQEGLPDDL